MFFLPGLYETSSLLLPVWVARAPWGCRLRELFQQCNVTVIWYPIYQFLQPVLGFAGACRFAVMCSSSAIDSPEVSYSPGRKALSRQLSGTMFVMASSETLPQLRWTRSESGSPLWTFYPVMPERSARTSSTVATMLPMNADILRASADDSPNPLAPWAGSPARVGGDAASIIGHPFSKERRFFVCRREIKQVFQFN